MGSEWESISISFANTPAFFAEKRFAGKKHDFEDFKLRENLRTTGNYSILPWSVADIDPLNRGLKVLTYRRYSRLLFLLQTLTRLIGD